MQKQYEDTEKKKKPKRSFRARVLILFINLLLICVACVGFYVLFVFLQMPSLDSVLHETREPAIIFLDKDGREIRADSRIMGTPVSVDTLPPHVWQAIVAIEDKRFFKHGAISYRGTLRAIFINLFDGKFAAGGSTITQQTVKNIFLSKDKKISRKIQELILSMWLENRFDKNQILDLYINRISLVGGMRGIDAAATNLFGHGANELTLAESAQIA
ncbi:MAG: transglycosylase domain-containing protein, partial [Alphaproteobacteria bacterium]